MTADWFVLPTIRIGNSEREAEIRPWEPGDGLACSAANYAKRVPCGAPVAVVHTDTKRDGYRSGRGRTSLYCDKHVVEVVRAQMGDADDKATSATPQILRAAEEAVLSRHWDEFQAELTALLEQHREKYLGMLPNWLRSGFDTAEQNQS